MALLSPLSLPLPNAVCHRELMLSLAVSTLLVVADEVSAARIAYQQFVVVSTLMDAQYT